MTSDEIIDVDDQEEFMEQENETFEKTFINPSQYDRISNDEMIRYKMCEFASARKSEIIDQRKSSHYWCHICF